MKKILLKILSLPILKRLFMHYNAFISREKHVSYGTDFPDRYFYIIGQKESSGGLWWIVNKVIMHLAYADEKGYIPIVDFKHFWTQYHNKGELNRVNVWEKFFFQPANYTLEEISHAKNIILSDKYASPSEKYLMGNTYFYDDKDRQNYFRNIFNKYIKFSDNTLSYLEGIRKDIIPNEARVVGVLCRGTDYLLRRPKNHPIQPNPEEVMQLTDKTMKEYHCDYVFLATEDEDILNQFENHFSKKLLYVKQRRVKKKNMNDSDYMIDINKQVNEDKYMMGLNYLSAIYILSKCSCFIGGRTGGTKGVLLMKGSFEFEYVYNLGFYD